MLGSIPGGRPSKGCFNPCMLGGGVCRFGNVNPELLDVLADIPGILDPDPEVLRGELPEEDIPETLPYCGIMLLILVRLFKVLFRVFKLLLKFVCGELLSPGRPGNCPNEACGLPPNAGWPGGGTLRLGVIDAAVGLLREVVVLPAEVPAPAGRAGGLPKAPV